MSSRSPYDLFGEGSLHLLRHWRNRGEDVLARDVAATIEANPELVPEGDARELVVKGLRGELKAKRGRTKSLLRQVATSNWSWRITPGFDW